MESMNGRGIASSDGDRDVSRLAAHERQEGLEVQEEVDRNQEAWTAALRHEGLLPPEADDLPIWLGIETQAGSIHEAAEDDDDSASDGSFQLCGGR